MSAALDIWTRLAAPLPTSAVEWRQDGKPLEQQGKKYARFVPFCDANAVRERLDAVVPGEWSLKLKLLPDARDAEGVALFAFRARLTIAGIAREDVGTGADLKAASSSAMKRAAARFGIASELHSRSVFVELRPDGKKPVEDPQIAYDRKHRSITTHT